MPLPWLGFSPDFLTLRKSLTYSQKTNKVQRFPYPSVLSHFSLPPNAHDTVMKQPNRKAAEAPEAPVGLCVQMSAATFSPCQLACRAWGRMGTAEPGEGAAVLAPTQRDQGDQGGGHTSSCTSSPPPGPLPPWPGFESNTSTFSLSSLRRLVMSPVTPSRGSARQTWATSGHGGRGTRGAAGARESRAPSSAAVWSARAASPRGPGCHGPGAPKFGAGRWALRARGGPAGRGWRRGWRRGFKSARASRGRARQGDPAMETARDYAGALFR